MNKMPLIAVLALLMSAIMHPVQTLAQFPTIKTEGQESGQVYMSHLDVDVSIHGTLAITTWTMQFSNKTSRILEGQLSFPLPEGTSISRYALDVNGKLREAVPVEKAKATQVFESTERRRIDPGLLEKVEGNAFRTRIYPIPARGSRTVLIAYEQELTPGQSRFMHYHLPMDLARPLDEFNLNLSVSKGAGKPVMEENISDDLQFKDWQNTWSASNKWKNFTTDHSLSIAVPVEPGMTQTLLQESGGRYYYSVTAFPAARRIAKPLPHRITLLWDASLNGLKRDHKKEFQLLDDYFAHLKNAEIILVPFSNIPREARNFSIQDGHWDDLKKALQDLIYDGGAQFGAIDPSRYEGDEFLLFSEGRSNYGSHDMRKASRPLYAIVASPNADFPYLRSLTGPSGGGLVNLETTSAKMAIDQLLYRDLEFLGIKGAPQDTYPSQRTSVISGISIAGIIDRPTADIILQFGYNGDPSIQLPVHLDYERQKTSGIDLSRIWARKKIAELDLRYDDNQTEISRLGRRFGIVTRNTSLIVLESVMDYVNNDIEPPSELRADYDAILKGRPTPTQTSAAIRDQAFDSFRELLNWWGQEIPEHAPAPKPSPTPVPVSTGNNVAHQPVSNPTVALQGRVAGLQVQDNNRDLQEVVVVGYATQRRRSVTGSVSRVNADNIDADDARDLDKDLPAGDAGIAGKAGNPATKSRGDFKVLRPEARTAYLELLRKARPEERYKVYLDARKANVNTPLFYFNSAEFFFDKGEKDLGLRIISNIAALELESYELFKMMGYQLRKIGDIEAACATFKKVLDWRPFEPQSYRDYALALEDAGHWQQALDTLYSALARNYSFTTQSLYPGIEETILIEINNLITRHGGKLDPSGIPKEWIAGMPVDIRVVLNWNMSDTDMDLWVTDPDNEKCYYSHRFTAMGGRISHDFTRGLGPEQFMLKKAQKGKYKVEVNYYGDTQIRLAGPTTLLVEIYTHYGTAQQTRRLIPLQMQSTNEKTVLIGEFSFE